MKLKTKLSKLRHDGHITDAEYSIIINALNKKSKERVQQPCEDAISREEAIRVAEQGQIQGYEWQFKKLCNLQSVTPKQKIRKSIIDVYKLDKIIVNAIDASTNKVECQTLRWVLDKISELSSVTPQEQQPCEDCISRAELLKYAQLVRDDEGIVHEMVHVDDIKGASSVTWSGWKSVTWELPEPNTAVLLYVKYKSSGQWTYQLGMWNDSKLAWEDWRTPYQLEEEFEVIAWMDLWMDLPEPYTKE